MSKESSTPSKPTLEQAVETKKADLQKALGGPMIPPPPLGRMTPVGPPGQVRPDPVAPRRPRKPARKHNPLFDAPGPDEAAARQAMLRLRSALGEIIQTAEAAEDIHQTVAPVLQSTVSAAPAAIEDFDFERATEFLTELRKLIDRF